MSEQPPAVLAPSVALERLSLLADDWESRRGGDKAQLGARIYASDCIADLRHELATLRASFAAHALDTTAVVTHEQARSEATLRAGLAQQGEAVAWMVGPKRDAMLQMLLAASEDIDEMAKRTGPSRFPSVEQLRGWRRMINSIMAALQETSAPQSAQEGAEVQRLRELALCVYVGPAAAHDLPENWLDALSSAGHGEAFSCDGLIPYNHPAAVDGAEIARIAAHIGNAVEYIEKAYPGTKTLDAGPILRNMRRWSKKLTAALQPAASEGENNG